MSNTLRPSTAQAVSDLAKAELVKAGTLAALALSGTPSAPVVGSAYRFEPGKTGGAGKQSARVEGLPTWLRFEGDTGAVYADRVPATAVTPPAAFTIFITDLAGVEKLISVTIPAATYPALGPTTFSFSADSPAGSLVAIITGLMPGEILADIVPNDGRLALSAGKHRLVCGLTASSAGTTNYTIYTTTGRSFSVAATVTAGAGGGAGPAFLLAPIGDSRVAQIHADSLYLNRAGNNHFPWGCALSGQRVKLTGNWGFSGDRTDQMLARLQAALASGAGTLYIHAGCNDIAQQYPSASTSGVTAFANIQTMADGMLKMGGQVLIVLEPGSTSMNAAQVTQVLDLNARLRTYAATRPKVFLFDLPAVAWANQNPTTAITFITGYSTDGTHQANRGGYEAGKAFKTFLEGIFPDLLPRVEGTQLLLNGTFTGSGGSLVGGASGIVAASWVGRATGSSTATFTVGTNEQIMAATLAAAGEEVRVQQDVNINNWSPGDIVQFLCEVEVDAGASGLAGVYAYLQANGVPTPLTTMDLFPVGATAVTSETYRVWLRSERMTIPAFTTKSWLTAHVKTLASGAGSATVRVRNARVAKLAA